MLKIEINCKPDIHSVQANGDMEDIILDLCMAINAIHTQIKRSNEIAAESFRRNMMGLLGSAYSPVWTREAPGGGLVIVVPDGKEKDEK